MGIDRSYCALGYSERSERGRKIMKSFVSPYNFVENVNLKVDPKDIIVYDTTLRDGSRLQAFVLPG